MRPSSAPAHNPPDLPGYRFLQHIGSGGSAQVYLYEHQLLARNVAVKVLNESALTDVASRRLIDEAKVAAGLGNHPHIVQVFEADVTPDGRPYLAMEYYPQANLSVRARRERFSVAEVLRTGIQIGGAVETSHRSNIVHRDIKPQNILTGQFGAPALTDFGIAATNGSDGPEGMSVPWSPPEVLSGASGDERSDVYSLGATLWHLLVGRSPFEQQGGDNTTFALMRRIKADPVPRSQRGDVPESLERLLRQAMAKDPAARPQTALDFIRALQAVEQELRLPVTQPALPGDGLSSAALAPRGTTLSFPPGDGPGGVRGPGGAAPHLPAGGDGDGASTLVRPRRVGPEPSAGGDGEATHRRAPRHIDPWPSAPPRERFFPPDVPDPATVARPVALGPGRGQPAAAQDEAVSEAAPPRSPQRRTIVIGACALVVAAATAVLVFHPHSGGQPGTRSAQSAAGDQSALGPAVSAPGTPSISVTRTSTGDVRFTWTYANPQRGEDIFRWKRVTGGSGPSSGITAKPELVVATSRGETVCVSIQVVRATGQASQSATGCWSQH